MCEYLFDRQILNILSSDKLKREAVRIPQNAFENAFNVTIKLLAVLLIWTIKESDIMEIAVVSKLQKDITINDLTISQLLFFKIISNTVGLCERREKESLFYLNNFIIKNIHIFLRINLNKMNIPHNLLSDDSRKILQELFWQKIFFQLWELLLILVH